MLMALPMGFYVFYIAALGIFNFLTRKSHAQKKSLRLSFFKTYQGEAPERVLVVGRHYDNQFELPMLFLITCLSTHIFQATGTLAIVVAWTFVVSRMIHSFIHLGSNNVLHRAFAFAVGLLCILVMWVNILFSF